MIVSLSKSRFVLSQSNLLSPQNNGGNEQKPQRLLPTNLYVVLYNFKSRHQDELDLKAGYKVSEPANAIYGFSRSQLHLLRPQPK